MQQNLHHAISPEPAHSGRLDLHDPDTVRALCDRFRCDIIALWDAAARVGAEIPALDRELTAH